RGVRVVVHHEQAAEDVAARTERIPEAGGDAAELLAIGRDVVDVPAFAAAGESGAIGTDQLVIRAEVLADAEVEVPLGVERQPAEAVVRVVAFRVEERDARLLIRAAGALRVAQ